MKRSRIRRKSVTSISKLKQKLWELCKQLTRSRHGNTCYTCYAPDLAGSNWHTGHYITSSVCSVEMRYSLENLRPQCYSCNVHKSGNWVAFQEHLEKDGVDIDELLRRNHETKGLQYDRLWYERKIAEYSQLYSGATIQRDIIE